MHPDEMAGKGLEKRVFAVVVMQAGTETIEKRGLTHAQAMLVAQEVHRTGRVAAVVRLSGGVFGRSTALGR